MKETGDFARKLEMKAAHSYHTRPAVSHVQMGKCHLNGWKGRGGWIPAILCMLLLSCKPELPAGVLPDSKMEAVLYDFHLAQAMSEVTSPNSSMEARRYELQEAVMRKHGITQAEFDSSMAYYCSDLERMNVIYSHLAQRFSREAEAYGASAASDVYAGLTADGDTANVWAGRQVFSLKNRLVDNIQSWQQTCDSTWLAGDEVLFRFTPVGFTRDGFNDIYATLVVVYTNDSVRGRTVSISSHSHHEIRIEEKEGWTPASVTGHFYVPTVSEQQNRIYVINHLSLIRFHKSQEWRDNKLREKEKHDSLDADTLELDTLALQLKVLHEPGGNDRRISPTEFREQQPVDRKIEIVKEMPYLPRKQGKSKGRRVMH